jgi:adenylosuccinate synthase
MSKAAIVIGANYGDEGKGQTVHSLSTPKSCVVRFNGGSQAGHTVVHNDKRHVFHQMGSGTMIGASTFLSREHIVNTFVHAVERKSFPDNYVYVDANARVTTFVDVTINQLIEEARGGNRHGSCGLGINETVLRNLNGTQLAFSDIGHPWHRDQLEYIWQVEGPERLKELGFENLIPQYFKNATSEMVKADLHLALSMKKDVRMISGLQELMGAYDHFVFEGAQGLLLSERNMFWYPHLTRSDTGVTNANALLAELAAYDIPESTDVHYVTRPYLTRHGAGPLSREWADLPYKNIVDKTNVTNDWQGTIRYAPLDLDQLSQFVYEDFSRMTVPAKGTLRVTCWDQMIDEPSVYTVFGNKLRNGNQADLLLQLFEFFPTMNVDTVGFTKDQQNV